MSPHEFIPSCPNCGYDLRGTPHNRCSECGEPFNRAKVFDPAQDAIPGPAPGNSLLVLAIFLSMFGWGFGRPYAEAKMIGHVIVVWLLAFAWVYLRRRAVFGDKPWLVLWLLLVAHFAPNRPNLEPPLEHWVVAWSVAVALAALAYAFIRRPIDSGRKMLYALCVVLGLGGAMFVLGPTVSQIFGLEGGSYGIFVARLDAGGINDAIVAAIGIIHLIAAYTIFRIARHLAIWQESRS